MIPAIGIGPLGLGEWSVTGTGSLSQDPATGAAGAVAPAAGPQSFSGALSKAVGALEDSQTQATDASQQLATGQLTDPTKAITAVENAQLMMSFASTVRNQLDTAATTLFQTQV